MPQSCFYFQLHQPYRISNFTVFGLENQHDYFSFDNKVIFKKVSQKSYRPMLTLLLALTKKYPDFKFALSCSGVFLEQALEFDPHIIELLDKLVKTGQVEMLAETYYHSLASLYSPTEFRLQVKQHQKLLKKLFGYHPQVFRNSELIYNNDIASQVQAMGFRGMLTEAVDRYLHGRERTKVYQSAGDAHLPLLLKHAPLSDDIAFRFSNKDWPDYPLTVDKYLDWVEIYPEDHLINLFMDFETFGEHQWQETGIFDFFAQFVGAFLQKKYNKFVTPTDVLGNISSESLPVYDVPQTISWADIDRDITAWVDNELQKDTIDKIYQLEKQVLATDNPAIVEQWRRLQTSDNFYYMCTKWANDGDVHAYFSPFESPYEAYRYYSIVLADLIIKIDQKNQPQQMLYKK